METWSFDINFSHKKGTFCTRKVSSTYSVYYFYTDFLYEVNGSLLKGNAGDMLIMPPKTVIYHGAVSSQDSFINDWLYFNENSEIDELLKKYPIPINKSFSVGHKTVLNHALKRIRKEISFGMQGYKEKIDLILRELIIDIYRAYLFSDEEEGVSSKMERVREELYLSPEKQWSLKEMAQLSGYSVSRFCAVYNEVYGISPKADLLRIRISKAKRMLKYSGRNITEIAEGCGFQSIYYFSKYFKAATGYSPSEYKKKPDGFSPSFDAFKI